MIFLVISIIGACIIVAWVVSLDSKKLHADIAFLRDELATARAETTSLRIRVEETEGYVNAEREMKKLGLTATHPAGQHPMQQFDPQAARRVQEQSRRQGKHRK